MKELIKMTYEEWENKFLPIFNNNDPEEGKKDFHPKIINEDERELLTVAIKENRAWTLIDGHDDNLYIIEGLHLVNRIDVYITLNPYLEEFTYEIPLYEQDEEELV